MISLYILVFFTERCTANPDKTSIVKFRKRKQPSQLHLGVERARRDGNHCADRERRLHVLSLSQPSLAACRRGLVDVARRAAEQRSRRLAAAAGRGRRREQPAGAVVVDGAWEVERLAPLPHQDGPAPQAAFFLFPAALLLAGVAVAGLLLVIVVGRHELPEVPAWPPCSLEEAARRAREAARRARDAACAGGRGAGHLAEETRHGRRRVRWTVVWELASL